MKQFIFLLLFPLGIFAQDSSVTKNRVYKIPTWDEHTLWQYRLSAGFSDMLPGQSAMASYNGNVYGDFSTHGGIVISNSLIRNYRQNPISLIADFSIAQSSFWMSFIDTDSNPSRPGNNPYRFKNLTLADIGFGAEIEGKYFFADIEYRLGYLTGGKVQTDSMVDLPIIRNGKLNLNYQMYQGLQLGVGMRFKGFHLRINGNLPLQRFQVNMYKDWECSMLVRSITLGYTWGLGREQFPKEVY